MKYNIPAVLFAGGKSSRMGKDKALLPFGKYNSLSEFQYKRLQKLFKEVYLSTKISKFDFDATLIRDLYEESSPLVGIVSIFESLPVEEVFILSVDAPFVTMQIITALMGHPKVHDAIIAKSPKGIEPLCGIYRRSILSVAKKHLEEKNHKLTSLLQKADTCFIDFEESSPFMNLNHPHEYKSALKLISF